MAAENRNGEGEELISQRQEQERERKGQFNYNYNQMKKMTGRAALGCAAADKRLVHSRGSSPLTLRGYCVVPIPLIFGRFWPIFSDFWPKIGSF